ncbi:MAG: S41 family peptidase [Terracidiphilus sp.]|jgi:hypothetical protein
MSEKIFACLLRLYPSRFREKYTEEAIQLYRDLDRHETGLLQRTGLWLGLLADLALGLPQAYRNTYVSTAASPVAQVVQGVPTFRVLELEPMRPGLFLFGSILTLALLGAFSVVLNHPVVDRVWGVSSVSSSPIEAVLERLNRSTSSGQSGNESPQTDDSVLGNGRNGEAGKTDSLATDQVAVETQKAIHPDKGRQLIGPAAETSNRHYPYQQPPTKAQEATQQNERHGAYILAPEGIVSVARRTPGQQTVTRDAQKTIAHSGGPIPSRNGPSAVSIGPYRATTKEQNCNFGKIEVLPHNIGYFKLDSFPDPAICGASADGAMIKLNETSAMIFDLRESSGGHPEMAEEIAAWLFERPAAWHNPGERSTAQNRTHSPVRSSRLGNKPVYILTSSQTVDSAEQFAYNLKRLRRATVIGERTCGETHSRPFYRNDDPRGISMRPFRSPYGNPDWEETGIAPDIEVKASDALQIAEASARAKIERK